MIQIMLVAGRGASGLKNYMMSSSSTITVSYCYENLVNYRNIIETEYITIDKFLYVYQDKDMDLRRDMSFLKGVLTKMNKGEGFFSCDEIVFFCNTTLDQSAVRIFETTMNMAGFTNYKIQTSTDNFAYTDIYKYMLNISNDNLSVTKHKNIVRVKKGSIVKQVYEPETDKSTEAIVNYDFDNMRQYEKSKRSAARSDTGLQYFDKEYNDTINQKFNNPVIHTHDITNPFTQQRKIYIVSGNPKSGVSTNTALLACSAVENGNTVTIVNLTKESSTLDYIRCLEYGYRHISLRNFMSEKIVEHRQPINVITVPAGIDDIRLQGLYYILEHCDKFDEDVIFIEVPSDILFDVLTFVGLKINRVFYSIENTERDLDSVYNFIDKISTEFKTVILLSELLSIMQPLNQKPMNKRLELKEIRGMFNDDVKIVSPLKIQQVDSNLYSVLTEV